MAPHTPCAEAIGYDGERSTNGIQGARHIESIYKLSHTQGRRSRRRGKKKKKFGEMNE